MSVKDLLQNELNKLNIYTFLVTEDLQQFYGFSVTDQDGMTYAPCVIKPLSLPFLENNYTTRRYDYIAYLKGLDDDLDKVKEAVSGLKTIKTDSGTMYFADLQIDSTDKTRDGLNKNEFLGSFRFYITVPSMITPNDIKLSINGTLMNEAVFGGTFDKSLLSNVGFGDNQSTILTGQEFTVGIPINANNPVSVAILKDTLNRSYNKTYAVKIDFGVATLDDSYILRKGTINYNKNDNPIIVMATFEKALPRTAITINDQPLEVIVFTYQMASDTTAKQVDMKSLSRLLSASKVVQVQVVNNNSPITNELISEINNATGKVFQLKYNVNGVEYAHNLTILGGSITAVDNPFAVITLTLGGVFNG